MYNNIMVPIDLAHQDRVTKAAKTAMDIAKLYGAKLTFVGVTSTAPSAVAHNPEEFAAKLQTFADACGSDNGMAIQTKALTSRDPAVDLDKTLNDALHAIGADLVVMASHVPHFREYVFASNAGYLASHTDVSVMIVR